MSTSSAEQQTVDVLLAYSAFTTAIGTNDRGTVKFFPNEIPDDVELPSSTYERGDSQPEYVLDTGGPVASKVNILIAVYAKTRIEADAIALTITAGMSAAGHTQTLATGDNVPEVEEYVAVRAFDVWEIS